jgi:hypothetical protein
MKPFLADARRKQKPEAAGNFSHGERVRQRFAAGGLFEAILRANLY